MKERDEMRVTINCKCGKKAEEIPFFFQNEDGSFSIDLSNMYCTNENCSENDFNIVKA